MDELCEERPAAERSPGDARVIGDARRARMALAAVYLGVSPAGVSGREDRLADLAPGPALTGDPRTGARAPDLGDGTGLPSCRARFTRIGCAAEEVQSGASVRCRADQSRVALFSQDTRAEGS